MTAVTYPIATEAEVRTKIATYLEAYRIDDFGDVQPGNVDFLQPIDAVVDTRHLNDDDFDVYIDARTAALEAATGRVEDFMRAVLIEAEVKATMAFLAEHPWAPLAQPAAAA